jgi:hypothetical protein
MSLTLTQALSRTREREKTRGARLPGAYAGAQQR